MPVEAATFITELDETLPADADVTQELDDHIRLVKSVLLNTLPGDGATDLFSQPLLSTLLQMNSWDARVDALEAAPTTVPSPKIGFQLIEGIDIVSITGIGFEPKQIMAWAVSERVQVSEMSFASWNSVSDNAFAHHHWSNPTVRGSKRFTQFLSTLSQSNSGTSEVLSVNSTNEDGFDIFINQNLNSTNLTYIAFP